jgi:hypothetical protein
LYKAKEKRAWSELFLHAALYLPGEQSLPANPDGRYREMPDISGQADRDDRRPPGRHRWRGAAGFTMASAIGFRLMAVVPG